MSESALLGATVDGPEQYVHEDIVGVVVAVAFQAEEPDRCAHFVLLVKTEYGELRELEADKAQVHQST